MKVLKRIYRSFIAEMKFNIFNTIVLSAGLLLSLVVLLWVNIELSYNSFFQNPNNIYRIISVTETSTLKDMSPLTPAPLPIELKEKYPQIETFATLYATDMSSIQYKNIILKIGFKFASKDFFDIFDFPTINGNVNSQNFTGDCAVISSKTAKKFFGDKNPIGNYVKDPFRQKQYKIIAVINIPNNTHFNLDIVIPFSGVEEKIRYQWGVENMENYVKLKKGAEFTEWEKEQLENYLMSKRKPKVKLFFQPIEEIHLFSDFNDPYVINNGNIGMVRGISFVGILILIITAINFVIYYTIRSEKRSKEIGIKKLFGATFTQLFIEYLIENIIYIVFAQFMAILLFFLFQPFFSAIIGKELRIHLDWVLIQYFVFSLIIVCIVSGAYLFFFLPSLNPNQLIKGVTERGKKIHISKILTFVQLLFTIFFVLLFLFAYKQFNFLKTKTIGISYDNVISINTQGFMYKYEAIKNLLLENPNIESVTASGRSPVDYHFEKSNIEWDGKPSGYEISFTVFSAAPSFLETFHIKLLKGMDFPEKLSMNDYFDGKYIGNAPILINETASELIGKDAIGRKISLGNESYSGYIMGVVDDFSFKSLKSKISPVAIIYDPESFNEIFIKYKEKKGVVNLLDSITKPFRYGKYAFDYYFVKSKINQIYSEEENIERFSFILVIISLFLSVISFVGAIIYSVNKQKKNISIRKVYGAESMTIVKSFVIKSIQMYILVFLFSSLFSTYFIKLWLDTYAYRTALTMDVFLQVLSIGAIFVSSLTAIFVFKESINNPINNLKSL